MKKSAFCFTCILTALLFLGSPVTAEPLSEALPASAIAPTNNTTYSLLDAPETSAKEKPSIQPNASLAKRGNLGTLCFSPVDTVTHYVGATIGDGSGEEAPSAQTEEALLLTDSSPWTLQVGAGVERQLSKRATFDLDYRYTSSPLELDLDTLRQTNCDGHRISAGFKVLF